MEHQFYVKEVVAEIEGQEVPIYEVRHRTIDEDGVAVENAAEIRNRFFGKKDAERAAKSMSEKANRV